MLSPNWPCGSLARRYKWHFNGSHENREGFARLFTDEVYFVIAADMIRYARTGRYTLATSEERSGASTGRPVPAPEVQPGVEDTLDWKVKLESEIQLREANVAAAAMQIEVDKLDPPTNI